MENLAIIYNWFEQLLYKKYSLVMAVLKWNLFFLISEPGTILEIRQGLTSDDYLLESLEWGTEEPRRGEEHVVAVDTGFYVRLRGIFSHRSKLAIVYTSFSYLGSKYKKVDKCLLMLYL